MKQGKKPTAAQRQEITKAGYNPFDWLVVKNLPEELHLIHYTGMAIKKISRK